MRLPALIVLVLLGHSLGRNTYREKRLGPHQLLRDPTCQAISDTISPSSAVYYPGTHVLPYAKGISHWASSSTQLAACVVEPGTSADVAKTLQILGSTRIPFAVKGGGHTTNPGFSSTTGVQISMYRFSDIVYNVTAQTVMLGAGLVWDDVYAALEPHGVNALGARSPGVGVAGFILGGGYSFKANQYGLTIDTVVEFELVKPDGSILRVTRETQPDLFFGLKGIVTRFTLKTFPETQVWGGLIVALAPSVDIVTAAVADFATHVTDPKANIITTYGSLLGQPLISQVLFYDAPNPPPEIFDKFMGIPYSIRDVGTRDMLSLVRAIPADLTANLRGVFQAAPVLEYTPNLLNAIVNESMFWGERLANLLDLDTGVYVSYDVEPFLPDILSHASSPSAYPPTRDKSYSPFNLYYAWLLEANDEDMYAAARQSAARIHEVAVAEGQVLDDAPLYPNNAMFGTPLNKIYGSNLPRLQALKNLHDPKNVMGLAGGWKF
ncbi:FAD-binding domain-containing protein [Macrolepiota fuliginosa MF-IS2]|uniref:FAD-binding domain-containing protein n=1 Tax=Macrolepiota fuliginosa MF-IS2 TaxID=1400762 RepID=A0A9P6C5H1_9AGAR|nr:FAD-binding domain-containing protein [Macrolepiota fuliginosa MF-IS2]